MELLNVATFQIMLNALQTNSSQVIAPASYNEKSSVRTGGK